MCYVLTTLNMLDNRENVKILFCSALSDRNSLLYHMKTSRATKTKLMVKSEGSCCRRSKYVRSHGTWVQMVVQRWYVMHCTWVHTAFHGRSHCVTHGTWVHMVVQGRGRYMTYGTLVHMVF